MSGGQALTLAMLALAWGAWRLAGWLLDLAGLGDAALPLGAVALALALTAAEAGLKRLRPPEDSH